ncbi:hypothetical protein [Hymenobacter terricola]|uniref:hypothetical protein n=1 Tax=Hymenobacter terricola TaxID=2819236 RepID=UPI001B315879|nr:hypothetical protein [Hymenobacter terricola]
MENPLEEIINWLDAGDEADYKAGLALLERYCKNRSLLNQLQRKDSANNREKLRYELIKATCGGNLEHTNEVLNQLAEVVEADVQVLVEQQGDALRALVFPQQLAPDVVPEAVQADVDDLTQLMARVYNSRCQLSNTLADIAEADGPRVVAEILSLQNQYNALAEKRRRLVAGEAVAEAEQPAAPEQEAAPVVDRGELVKQRQNLRSNISKAKGKLTAAKSDAKKSELEQKVGQLTVELATLDMQLALPQV